MTHFKLYMAAFDRHGHLFISEAVVKKEIDGAYLGEFRSKDKKVRHEWGYAVSHLSKRNAYGQRARRTPLEALSVLADRHEAKIEDYQCKLESLKKKLSQIIDWRNSLEQGN